MAVSGKSNFSGKQAKRPDLFIGVPGVSAPPIASTEVKRPAVVSHPGDSLVTPGPAQAPGSLKSGRPGKADPAPSVAASGPVGLQHQET
ncbi:MAG: hypothetical protein ACLQDY_08340 [Streptosporangiaceae bacterium]